MTGVRWLQIISISKYSDTSRLAPSDIPQRVVDRDIAFNHLLHSTSWIYISAHEPVEY